MEKKKISEENVAEKEAPTKTTSNPAVEPMESNSTAQAKPAAPKLKGSDLEAHEAVEYVNARYPKAKEAYDNAENEYVRVKIEIGLYLFNKFWDSNEELFKDGKFAPNKEKAYKKMLKDPEFPIKSAATLSNIINAGVQMHWLELQGITIEEAAKLGWTNIIRLLPLENGDAKLQIIDMIRERNSKVEAGEKQENGKPYKKMTAAEVANAVTRIRNPKPELAENIKEILDGIATAIAPVSNEDFLQDLQKAQVRNEEGKYVMEDELRTQMREKIGNAKKEINKVLRQLSAMVEELKTHRMESADEEKDEEE